MNLKRLGATVLHGIDVQKMKFHTYLKDKRFDRIVYNFPHAGFKGKEYEPHMINLHKKLVRGYFCNARHLLRPCGEIHVSHKSGPSYDKWDLEQIAAEFSLILVEKVGFQKAQYPGYNQKKGDGPMCDKSFPLGTCFTFKFRIGDLKKLKQQNRRRAGSVSSPPPDSIVLMPTTLLPHVDVQRQPSGFALNFSMPGRLDALGTTAGISPPMGRITSTTLLTTQWHPLYEPRIIAVPLAITTDYFFAREYQGSLRREFEVLRQVMHGATNLTYSAFLEHRHRESVQRQEWLRRMIANSRQ